MTVDDRELRRRLHLAQQRRLSGLSPDPYLARRVLSRAREGQRFKKRLTVGVILAVMLMASAALAIAWLSGKAFVKEVIAPASIRQESDRFTQEEADEIIRIARENGIELTQPMLDGLSSMYKETWMLQFMKLDYGFYPAAWPLEEQAWLDALLVSCGLREQRTRFLPAEGEISEETAIETAAACIREAWGAGVLDGTTRYVQYMLTEDASGALCKRWDVEFEDAAGNAFLAQITPEGRVEQIINRPAEPPVESVEVTQTVSETLSLLYDDSFFTVENLARLREEQRALLPELAQAQDEDMLALRQLLTTPYALPAEDEISPREAMERATQAAGEQGFSAQALSLCKSSISYRQYEGEPAVYRVCFKLKPENRQPFYEGRLPFGIVLYISPADGSLTQAVVLEELDDFERWCEFPDPHDTLSHPGVG